MVVSRSMSRLQFPYKRRVKLEQVRKMINKDSPTSFSSPSYQMYTKSDLFSPTLF